MNYINIAAASFIIALSGALMPGPVLTVTLSYVPRYRRLAGLYIVTGHAVLEILLLALIYGGFSGFLAGRLFFIVSSLAGGGILIYMGITDLLAVRRASLSGSLASAGAAVKKMHPVLAGIITSLSNPYWIIWWATIGMVYLGRIMGRGLGLAGVLVFFAGHILADYLWYYFVSFSVYYGSHGISDRLYRGLMAACALFLILFGGKFIYDGILKAL